jgi:hypothetical protein
MIMRIIIAAGALLLASTPALAQDIGPALEMGPITGEAAMSHLEQSERKRAGEMARRGSPADGSAKARANCARLPELRAKHSGDPRIGQLAALCKQLGY